MDSRLRGNDKMKRQAELRTAQGEGAVEITTSGFALLVMTMVGYRASPTLRISMR